MQHYVWSLAIFFGFSTVAFTEERLCLYWPVYLEGTNALYIADWIDTSDPDPCGNAEFTYYWGSIYDPLAPENCPDCRSASLFRSPQFSSTEKLKPLNHFAGLQKQISNEKELTDLVPESWQRYDANQRGDYSWSPRDGVTCQHSRIVEVNTEMGQKVQLKLFDVKFSPGRANLPQGLIKSKTLKLGYEVTGVPQSSSTAYEPKRMSRHHSANQGLIRVDGANYTVISKTPLFKE